MQTENNGQETKKRTLEKKRLSRRGEDSLLQFCLPKKITKEDRLTLRTSVTFDPWIVWSRIEDRESRVRPTGCCQREYYYYPLSRLIFKYNGQQWTRDLIQMNEWPQETTDFGGRDRHSFHSFVIIQMSSFSVYFNHVCTTCLCLSWLLSLVDNDILLCVVKKERVRVTERIVKIYYPTAKTCPTLTLFSKCFTQEKHTSLVIRLTLERQVSYEKLLHYSLSLIYTPYGQLLTHCCVVIDWTLPSDFKKEEGSCKERREGKDNNRHVEEGSEREKDSNGRKKQVKD